MYGKAHIVASAQLDDPSLRRVTTVCLWCTRVTKFEVPSAGLASWANGELIQIAFPLLNQDLREMLISGVCPECWNDTFNDQP